MTEDQDERLVRAFESLAQTAAACRARYFPDRMPPQEATVTHLLTEEERIREDQGQTGEPIDEWLTEVTPGRRERDFMERAERDKEKPKGEELAHLRFLADLQALGISDREFASLPPLTESLRVAKDGLTSVLSAMRLSSDPAIAAFLKQHDKHNPRMQETMPWEVWAYLAKVDVPQLIGNIMLALRAKSVNEVKVLAITHHPDVIRTQIAAAQTAEGYKDRRDMNIAMGFLASPKGPTFIGHYHASGAKSEDEDGATEPDDVDVDALFTNLADTQKLLKD